MTKRKLTHLSSKGEARMVDVSEKKQTERSAIAEGFVHIRVLQKRGPRDDPAKRSRRLAHVFQRDRVSGGFGARCHDRFRGKRGR